MRGNDQQLGGEVFACGVVLKAEQSEPGAAAFEPVVTAGIGERHHAETRAGQASETVGAGPALLQRGQLGGPQDAAHGLAAEAEAFLRAKFFCEMGIVEARYLPRARPTINSFWGAVTAQGMARPRLPWCTQATESGR